MEDSQIVQLYWERDARAIPASSEAYGTYCHSIAFRILFSEQDAEEAVNDTWLHAWNAIPPHRPAVLSTFLGKLTRRISLTMLQRRQAQKRGGGEFDLVLEELGECVSGGETAGGGVSRAAGCHQRLSRLAAPEKAQRVSPALLARRAGFRHRQAPRHDGKQRLRHAAPHARRPQGLSHGKGI